MRHRDIARKIVLPLEGGDLVVDRLLSMELARFDALTAIEGLCVRILSQLSEFRDQLDVTPSSVLAKVSRNRLQQLREFLDVDPQRCLVGINASI